jgi:hypothetical protein
MIPFNKNHFHYNWHWYWDTATGEFGNNGVHGMDRIRLGMKKNVHPRKISCVGGFYAQDSDQQVPNLQVATFEYEDGTIMEMEVRSLFTPSEDGLLYICESFVSSIPLQLLLYSNSYICKVSE